MLRSTSAQLALSVGMNEQGVAHVAISATDPSDARNARHDYVDQSNDPLAVLRHVLILAEKELELVKADWKRLHGGRPDTVGR